jgi:hypothetical protein
MTTLTARPLRKPACAQAEEQRGAVGDDHRAVLEKALQVVSRQRRDLDSREYRQTNHAHVPLGLEAHALLHDVMPDRRVHCRHCRRQQGDHEHCRVGEGRVWVATPLSSLRIHRRKAVSEVPVPESGLSPLSAPDPELPDDVFMGNGGLLIPNLPLS